MAFLSKLFNRLFRRQAVRLHPDNSDVWRAIGRFQDQ